jgi:MFS family permease
MTKIKYYSVMIWLIGTLFYSYEMLIKSSISAMSDIFLHNYGLTAIQLSALGSYFYMVYVVLMIPAAILVDKLGVRKALITASFIAALGTMLYAFGSSFTGFAIARVVMGVGGSFAFVSALKPLRDRERRSRGRVVLRRAAFRLH